MRMGITITTQTRDHRNSSLAGGSSDLPDPSTRRSNECENVTTSWPAVATSHAAASTPLPRRPRAGLLMTRDVKALHKSSPLAVSVATLCTHLRQTGGSTPSRSLAAGCPTRHPNNPVALARRAQQPLLAIPHCLNAPDAEQLIMHLPSAADWPDGGERLSVGKPGLQSCS